MDSGAFKDIWLQSYFAQGISYVECISSLMGLSGTIYTVLKYWDQNSFDIFFRSESCLQQ